MPSAHRLLAGLLAAAAVLSVAACAQSESSSAEPATSPALPSSAVPSETSTAAAGRMPDGARETIEALPQGETAAAGERLSSQLGGLNPNYTMDVFLEYVMRDVSTSWTGVWQQAGYSPSHVYYKFPAPGESVRDECSSTKISPAEAAQYCPLDDQIVVTQATAQGIWEGRVQSNEDPSEGRPTGDFSVAYAVAHEYAHSLQGELKLIRTREEDPDPYPVYKTELHADCWAGVWANSAYYKGILESGDVEEAIASAALVGDYGFTNAKHHGTPAQRQAAFSMGYNSGVPSACQTWLDSVY